MYTLICTKHTYALKIKLFWWKLDFLVFHVLRNFILSLIVHFHDNVFHINLTTHLIDVFSWFCFHEYNLCFIDFECLVIMWLTYFSWNIFLFYSLLKGFRTSLTILSYNSCVLFILVEFSIVLKLFSNLFLKTPTHPRAVGWATMPCMHYWKSI